MKEELLKILSCPYNEDTHLEMGVRKKENDEIIEGVLRCEKCERLFPIISGFHIYCLTTSRAKIRMSSNSLSETRNTRWRINVVTRLMFIGNPGRETGNPISFRDV
jgi:uncharacterized protein YbaR (Trm112 family)